MTRPRLTRIASALLGLASTMVLVPAEAKLVRLDISSREVIADGEAFGQAGAYEKLTGTASTRTSWEGRSAMVSTSTFRASTSCT